MYRGTIRTIEHVSLPTFGSNKGYLFRGPRSDIFRFGRPPFSLLESTLILNTWFSGPAAMDARTDSA